MTGATGDAEDGLRLEWRVCVFGESEVGDDEPEFLDGPGPAGGTGEKETLLLEAFDPDRDRFLMLEFLILDKNREVVLSFFSGLVLLKDPRADEGPTDEEAGCSGAAAAAEFPEAFAFA